MSVIKNVLAENSWDKFMNCRWDQSILGCFGARTRFSGWIFWSTSQHFYEINASGWRVIALSVKGQQQISGAPKLPRMRSCGEKFAKKTFVNISHKRRHGNRSKGANPNGSGFRWRTTMAVLIVNHRQPLLDEKSQDSRNKLPLMFLWSRQSLCVLTRARG